MKLLGTTRELKILTDNCHIDEKNYDENSGINYPLYEANYISGMKMIFQKSIVFENSKKKKEKREIEEISNILSFIGGRGSGKTTAMTEFCSILSQMNNKDKKKWWMGNTLNEEERDFLLNKDFYFHVLKPIDASLLNDRDDLFELILANLYREFESEIQHKTYGYKDTMGVQSILNDFSEIAKLYQNVILHNSDEVSFISKLQIMKGSQQIKEKIEDLVKNLCFLKNRVDYEYVVISIDDLDLNLKHGYEMLEQLQKYFSCDKIIILVTLEYEQMKSVCEEYFWKTMPNTSKLYLDSQKNKTLANDYMAKVFPVSQRMYMPEMQRISKKSKIRLSDEVFKIVPIETDKKKIEVKKFVLLKIAEIMGIYYDACGLKRHFMEPETVRSLVFYNRFLESLEEIDYENLKTYRNVKYLGENEHERNKEILKKYDKNHERFNADISVRMAGNLLNYEQKRVFDVLTKRDLERRAKYFISAKWKEDKLLFRRMSSNYAYGDLLGKIHGWSDENPKGDYFADKSFIRCILASFTSEMVCEYIKYKHYPDEEERMKYKKRLLDFMGDSFNSRWLAESFARVERITNKKEDTLSPYFIYREEVAQKYINFNISLDIPRNERINKVDIDKYDIEKWLEKWFENTSLISTLEYVDMFFVRRDGTMFKGITYEFNEKTSTISTDVDAAIENNMEASKKMEDRYVLNVTGKDVNNVTLDIMGFVAKSMNYRESVTTLHNNIEVGLKTFFIKYFQINESINNEELEETLGKKKELEQIIENKIKDKIYEQSIFKEYIQDPRDVSKTFKEFPEDVAFPYYNLDMSYNIFKRVREYYKNNTIAEENILKELIGFYQKIDELLKKEEIEYGNSKNFKYRQIYKECPYIKNLIHKENLETKKKKEKNLEKQLSPVLKEIFHSIYFELDISKNLD